ncbi:MAG: hypothetical protein HUJ51_00815 [Eggerthellaceae bacterium]|nr:hypothetical protein [Eggerthellaceae bacterium]
MKTNVNLLAAQAIVDVELAGVAANCAVIARRKDPFHLHLFTFLQG